jgi:hypothetical protein
MTINRTPPPEPITLRALLDLIREANKPDDQFADDLAEIQASQSPIGDSPWDS